MNGNYRQEGERHSLDGMDMWGEEVKNMKSM